MSGGGGLHAVKIDCLVSRLLVGIRWLYDFARHELHDYIREIRHWCLILNIDVKAQPGTHCVTLYAPKAGPITLFDSLSFYPINYSLDSLNIFYLGCTFQLPSTSVCGH